MKLFRREEKPPSDKVTLSRNSKLMFCFCMKVQKAKLTRDLSHTDGPKKKNMQLKNKKSK